jgi:RNA polymerase sigma-70 factor (ECF subfamily)
MDDGEKMGSPEIDAIRATVLGAYKRHSSELSRMAVSRTRNHALRQDILQETFLRYFLSLTHGEEITDERAWLCGVVRGLILGWRKSLKAEALVALDEVDRTPAETRDEQEPRDRALPSAIKASWILAPRERECISLRAQGLAYHEIASAMQIEVGTVGAILNRAVRKLKQTLPHGRGWHDNIAKAVGERVAPIDK